jgi:hypothetical protein
VKRKIGWQKYEDIIENQMNSPVLDTIFKKMKHSPPGGPYDDADGEDGDMDQEDLEDERFVLKELIPIDPKISEMITLSSNFECWMGHANFNLTEEVRDNLKQIDGVEILKICSRYRFFIGIGRMFDFSEVRTQIQKELLLDSEEKQD